MTTSRPDDRPPLVDPRVDRGMARDVARRTSRVPRRRDPCRGAPRRRSRSRSPSVPREARAARRQWWPLAAAATVAAIAVGVLQLTPREELGAPAAETAVVSDVPAPVARVAPQSAQSVPPADETRRAGGDGAPVRKETSRADASPPPASAAGAPAPKRPAAAPVQVSPPVAEPFPGAPKVAANTARPSAAPLAEPVPPQEAPRSLLPWAAWPRNARHRRAAQLRRAEIVAAPAAAPAPHGCHAPAPPPPPRTEAAASRMSERASPPPAAAPLAKMAAGSAADSGASDARIKERTRCRSRTGSRSSAGCATKARLPKPRRSSSRFAPRTSTTKSCCRPICATGGRRRNDAALHAPPTLTTFAAPRGGALVRPSCVPRTGGHCKRRRQQLPDRRGQRGGERVVAREPKESWRFGARGPCPHGHALWMHRQPVMREAVLDRIELVPDDDVGEEPRLAMPRDIGREIDFGKAPQPGPDAERQGAFRGGSRRHAPSAAPDPARRARLRGTRRRQLGDAIFAARHAICGHRTFVAARHRPRADRRAEIHQRLRVGRRCPRCGRSDFGELP